MRLLPPRAGIMANLLIVLFNGIQHKRLLLVRQCRIHRQTNAMSIVCFSMRHVAFFPAKDFVIRHKVDGYIVNLGKYIVTPQIFIQSIPIFHFHHIQMVSMPFYHTCLPNDVVFIGKVGFISGSNAPPSDSSLHRLF